MKQDMDKNVKKLANTFRNIKTLNKLKKKMMSGSKEKEKDKEKPENKVKLEKNE